MARLAISVRPGSRRYCRHDAAVHVADVPLESTPGPALTSLGRTYISTRMPFPELLNVAPDDPLFSSRLVDWVMSQSTSQFPARRSFGYIQGVTFPVSRFPGVCFFFALMSSGSIGIRVLNKVTCQILKQEYERFAATFDACLVDAVRRRQAWHHEVLSGIEERTRARTCGLRGMGIKGDGVLGVIVG